MGIFKKTKKEDKKEYFDVSDLLEQIKNLRSKVILDYCRNNLELDAKIDENYEKSSIQKIKIK